ncbi:MAG TPA: hypothetical protein VMU81_25150 [Acetobacteraceae bacterium]|nr:hypothetical protein [Acetobacteraceae bacterium]
MAPSRRASVLRGIVRIARAQPDGLDEFTGTRQGFLASLAPLLAFPLVSTLLALLHGDGIAAVADLLVTLPVLLAPPVLSWEFARLWHRQDRWLRFATAFNWCQWLLPLLASVLLVLAGALLNAGLSQRTATGLLVACLAAYGLWLHWFVARHGLALSRFRAVLLVAGVNIGTAFLVLVPSLLAAGHL